MAVATAAVEEDDCVGVRGGWVDDVGLEEGHCSIR